MKKQLIALILLMASMSIQSFAQQWKQVTTPNTNTIENWFRGISGTSATDIWAVGHAETNTGPLSGYTSDNVMMHWNGTGWTSFPVANPGTDINELWSVAAVDSNLAWAVGEYTMGTNLQLVKWNGSSWTQQSLGTIADQTYLRSVWALSASDAWAVGGKSTTTPFLVEGCLTLHYNGSSWTQVPVPAVGTYRNRFNAINGIAANDAWAVGTWGNAYPDFNGLLMHWNGSAWSNSSLAPAFTEIWDVKMIAANDVWAIGEKTVGGPFSTVHWDGAAWTEYALPGEDSNVFTVALAVKPNHDVFAFGNHIHKWNGSAWVIVDSLTRISDANVKAAATLPTTGEIWAAGRYFDAAAGSYYKNLVLRQDTGSTGTNGGTTGIKTIVAHIETVQVVPNPFHKDLRMRLITNTSEPATVSLKDAVGRTVLHQNFSLVNGENNIPLNVPGNAAKGMYMLEVRTAVEACSVKLVRE